MRQRRLQGHTRLRGLHLGHARSGSRIPARGAHAGQVSAATCHNACGSGADAAARAQGARCKDAGSTARSGVHDVYGTADRAEKRERHLASVPRPVHEAAAVGHDAVQGHPVHGRRQPGRGSDRRPLHGRVLGGDAGSRGGSDSSPGCQQRAV
eukprot:837087-Rhodomonas_salina.2